MKIERILVAINDSEPAGWAVETAVDLAQQIGAQIVLLHVVNRARAVTGDAQVPSAELLAELRRKGNEMLQSAARRVPAKLAAQTILKEGKPADEVVEAASEAKVQLVVLGTHGRSRLSHLLLGSTAEAVIRQAPCAVLTVRNKPGNGNGSSKHGSTSSTTATTR